LDATLRALAAALALAASGRMAELKHLYARALESGVPFATLREGALMAHLFGGFPRAIEGLTALVEVAPHEPTDRPPPDSSSQERSSRGADLFRRIYQTNAHMVRARLRALSPVLEQAIIEDAYGRVLSRKELDARTREIMAVCTLTVLELPRQLESHVRGALSCGATREEIAESIRIAEALGADHPARHAGRLLDDQPSRQPPTE